MTSEIRIELSVEESVINQCNESLLHAINHTETSLVHGIVLFKSYVAMDNEKGEVLNQLMSRKRGVDHIDHSVVHKRKTKSFE